MFQFLTHVELSRSMAAILEMPQYVAYQKNVVYSFIKFSEMSHSFNILCTTDVLSCPTINFGKLCPFHGMLIHYGNFLFDILSGVMYPFFYVPNSARTPLEISCFMTFIGYLSVYSMSLFYLNVAIFN